MIATAVQVRTKATTPVAWGLSEDDAWTPKKADDRDFSESRGLLSDGPTDFDADFAHLLPASIDKPNYVLSVAEIETLTDKVFGFCKLASNVQLYPYQEGFAKRMIYSLLSEDSEEITALFSRQSGKTEAVAVTVSGLMVILPKLATLPRLCEDSRIKKFANGLWVGVFGPTAEVAGIMYSRIRQRLRSKDMRDVMSDPDFAMELPEQRNIVLPNGSFADCVSASPQSKIEGKTYHLMLCLGGDAKITTPDGAFEIRTLVESGYSGKVLSLDHETGEVVWADVLARQKFEAYNEAYVLTFDNGAEVTATEEHLWWVDGHGYVSTRDLSSFYNTALLHKRESDGTGDHRNSVGRQLVDVSHEAVEDPASCGESFDDAARVRLAPGRPSCFADTENLGERKPRQRQRVVQTAHGLSCRADAVLAPSVPREQKSRDAGHAEPAYAGRRSVLVDGRRVGAAGVGETVDLLIHGLREPVDTRLVWGHDAGRTSHAHNTERAISSVPSAPAGGALRADRAVRCSVDALQTDPGSPRGLRHLSDKFHTVSDDIVEPVLLQVLPDGTKAAVRLVSIRRVPAPQYVYDLTTSTGNFFADGVLSHNCEETQFIPNHQLRKSIEPMGAAVAATMVKIGTCGYERNDFYDACQRGRKANLHHQKWPTHFEHDYSVASKYNYRYKAYVAKVFERQGFDSDEVKLAFRLIWLLDRGQFIDAAELQESAIKSADYVRRKVRGQIKTFKRPDYPATRDPSSLSVAGIDIGKSGDSTVVTVGRVFWDFPVYLDGNTDDARYFVHVTNWLELQGDDHETQYPKIVDFLSNFVLAAVCVDATGMGSPIYERLKAKLSRDYEARDLPNPIVQPFVFGEKSKHLGYTLLREELQSRRLTYPGGRGAVKMQKYVKFVDQMTDLRKSWRGSYMVVEAPRAQAGRGVSKKYDDFPDSLMLMCWAAHRAKASEASDDTKRFGGNPFYADGLRSGIPARRDFFAERQERLRILGETR